MRTCPACGEDTEAQTTEPCTECGFSPVSPDDGASWEQSSWAEAPEATAPDATVEPPPILAKPPPTDASPEYGLPDATPTPQPATKKARVGAVWVILILIGLSWQAFSIFDGCGEIFSEATGPTASETEAALVSDAALMGLTVTASCPDSAEDTEVGATFECTITSSSGSSASVAIINREDEFEWTRGPFLQLLRQESGP